MRHLPLIGLTIALAGLPGCQTDSPGPNVVVLVLDLREDEHRATDTSEIHASPLGLSVVF